MNIFKNSNVATSAPNPKLLRCTPSISGHRLLKLVKGATFAPQRLGKGLVPVKFRMS